jgi:hypothetical protein
MPLRFNPFTGNLDIIETEAHAATHVAAGTDPLTLSESQITNLTTDLAAKAIAARQIVSGGGLTGGGDLSADRTLAVGAGTGITVNADDIAVNYGTTNITACVGNDSRLSDARAPLGFTEQSTSETGTQNNFNLSNHCTRLRCSGAAPAFTGFTVLGATPSAGDCVFIDNIGTSTEVTSCEHQNSNSTATNRIMCPSTSGQIIGIGGRMLLMYDAVSGRWLENVVEPGKAITPAYAAGDYTASGSMTWTVEAGDVTTFGYLQIGKKVYFSVALSNTTVGGTASTQLRIALPSRFTIASSDSFPAVAFDNSGALSTSRARSSVGANYLILELLSGANWALSTNNSSVYVSGSGFEVN